MQPFYPCFQEMPKSVGKNVNIDLFEEGYPQEAAEPPSHIKGGFSRVNLPSYMIEVKRKI